MTPFCSQSRIIPFSLLSKISSMACQMSYAQTFLVLDFFFQIKWLQLVRKLYLKIKTKLIIQTTLSPQSFMPDDHIACIITIKPRSLPILPTTRSMHSIRIIWRQLANSRGCLYYLMYITERYSYDIVKEHFNLSLTNHINSNVLCVAMVG